MTKSDAIVAKLESGANIAALLYRAAQAATAFLAAGGKFPPREIMAAKIWQAAEEARRRREAGNDRSR